MSPTPISVHQKGSPVLLVLIILVLVPSLAAGSLLGAGGSAVLGAFIALFTLMGSVGGALAADLKRAVVIGLLIAFSAVTPRLIAEVSTAGAFALVVLIIFVAGLLPLRARRNDAVALGLGMGTLFGYSLPISGEVSPWQLVAAGLIGFAVAVLLRVLLGIRDPHGPVRAAVGGLFKDPASDFGAAFDSWLSDRPSRWLGTALIAAGRYRLTRHVLEAQNTTEDQAIAARLTGASSRATAIGEAIQSRSALTTPDDPSGTSSPKLPSVAASAASAMDAALDDAEAASRHRDESFAEIPKGLRRKIGFAALRAGLRNGSIQVRHALRAALAVLLALLVSLMLPQGDPLLPTLLVTTFAIVQISWRATLLRTRDRVLGVLAGGALVVILLIVLPHALLLPMSLVGLAVGMWFITARPAISIAAMLVMSVGLNTGLRHLDPVGVVIQYIALALTAVVIGGVIGFAVIPAWRPQPLPIRVAVAVSRVASVLSALSAVALHETPKDGLRLLEQAQAATQQLVPDREQLDTMQQYRLEQLRTTLNDLTATALFAVSRKSPGASAALQEAAEILSGSTKVRTPPDGRTIDSAVLLLASSAAGRRDTLLSSLDDADADADLSTNEQGA